MRPRDSTLVPGIEINTTYKGNEVHVLGYGLPLDDSPVRRLIDRNRNSRRDRAAQMIAQLRGAGYDITLDQVRAEATEDDPALGRPHVARALVKAGLIRDVDACFRTVLGRGGVGYVPQTYTTPQEAVDVIAQSGGVPVLAHPGRLKDQSIVDELAEYGVVGLEVFYPTHSSTQVAYYREVAERYGLVMTAGADFHDIRWHPAGVGMDVDRDDIEDFLDLYNPLISVLAWNRLDAGSKSGRNSWRLAPLALRSAFGGLIVARLDCRSYCGYDRRGFGGGGFF